MSRRLLIGLVVGLAVLAGLYQLRIELLTTAFNTSLKRADITLLQLEGLEVGWDGMDIEYVALGLGEDNARQTLEGVHLSYSLLQVRPEALTVQRAALSPPASAVDSSDDAKAETQLLLTELIEQVISGPLQSIRIDALDLNNFHLALFSPALRLQATWENQHFLLEVQDQDKQLQLQLKRIAANHLVLGAELTANGEDIVVLSAEISQRQEQHVIQGEGQLLLAPLQTLLTPLIELPTALSTLSGQLDFTWSGGLDNDLLQPSQKPWHLRLLPGSRVHASLAHTEELPQGADLSVNLPEPVLLTLQTAAGEDITVTMSAEALAWQLSDKHYAATIAGQLVDIGCHYQHKPRCQTGIAVQLELPLLNLAGEEPITVTALALELSGQLELADEQLSASLAPGEWLRAESLVQGEVTVLSPALSVDSKGQLSAHLASGEMELQIGRAQLMLPRVELSDMSLTTLLSLSGLTLRQNIDGIISGEVHLNADAINLQSPGSWLPALAVAADLTLEGPSLTLQAEIQSDGHKPLATIFADYQRDTEQGSAHLRARELVFDPDDNRLSQYFAHWPFEWDILEGDAKLDLELKWQPGNDGLEFAGTIEQQLLDLAGVYQDIGFVGLSGEFSGEFSSPDHFKTTRPATLNLESLDVGVPVEAIKVRFELDSAHQELSIASLEAQLFGGRVWTEDAVYRADRDHNPVYVGVDGLQVSQLLALAGYDAIEGTGQVSGLLPLNINTAGLTMERGLLAAKAPGGVFRYSTEVAAGTNAAMVQVFKALSNYHYTIFQVQADYLASGDLELEMLLRGSNPDLQQGRPIHLNMTVTDHIPTLLKSLQSSRVITETLSKKLGAPP